MTTISNFPSDRSHSRTGLPRLAMAESEGSMRVSDRSSEEVSIPHEGTDTKSLTLSNELNNFIMDAALGGTVDILHEAGIPLLTVAGWLDLQPYEYVGKYDERGSTWTCHSTWTLSSTSDPTTPAPTLPPLRLTHPVPLLLRVCQLPRPPARVLLLTLLPLPARLVPPTKATPHVSPMGHASPSLQRSSVSPDNHVTALWKCTMCVEQVSKGCWEIRGKRVPSTPLTCCSSRPTLLRCTFPSRQRRGE